jgi:hypothetical protein
VTIGCSHTMGTGIHHEDTYSCYLENLAGIPVYNMGLGGSSNEVSFLNLVWLLTNFNPPKMIIFQKAAIDRFPLISENAWLSFNGPWSAKNNNDLRDFMVSSDIVGHTNTKFLLLESMLRQLTTKHGVNLYVIHEQIPLLRLKTEFHEVARDLMHGGANFNEFLAKYIWKNISKISEIYSLLSLIF